MKNIRIGWAMCGSFCTHGKVLRELEALSARYDVIPILSAASAGTDTRFGRAEELWRRLEELTGHTPLATVEQAEPIGPQRLLDVLVVAPCTGNTIGKLAAGITDTTVTMAAKAHLRNERPVVLALATNDGLSGSAAGIGALLNRKGYYFVPFGQDDSEKKPRSLMADFSRIEETVAAALEGRQLQPILL